MLQLLQNFFTVDSPDWRFTAESGTEKGRFYMPTPLEQLKEIREVLKKNAEEQQRLEEQKKIEAQKKAAALAESFGAMEGEPEDSTDDDAAGQWERFINSSGDIIPLKNSNIVALENIPLASEAAMEYRRKSAVTETVQEIHEFTSQFVKYLDPNDLVGFKKDGVQYGVYAKVKHGEYQIRARLDLHKHTLEQARSHTQNFLNYCYDRGFRFIIIVHGKGEFTSPKAFLKSHVYSWMKQSELVLAAHSAMPYHGGAGALYVLLKKNNELKSENRQKYM
jgi:DNA-nicking Smr family endonuclease